MNYLTVKQRQDLAKIANSYPNLQCVQCALGQELVIIEENFKSQLGVNYVKFNPK